MIMLGSAVLAYLLLASRLGNAPMQDLPNHLARAHIIADLLFNNGQVYGQDYTFQTTFAPYLIGDLILAGLDHLFGMSITARIWIGALLLLMPWSMVFVARIHGLSPRAAAAAALCSLYIATDWFFCLGFMNFQLAIPFAMFAYGWFLRAKRSGSVGAYIGFLSFTILGYLMHLSGLIFTIAMVGVATSVACYKKELSVARGARLLVGPLLLLAGHFALSHLTATPVTPAEGEDIGTNWGTVTYKLRDLTATFRFGRVREAGLLLVLLVAVCYPIRAAALTRPRELELALIVAAFMALYLMIPLQSGGVFFLDIRAIPYALLFLILLGLACGDASAVDARRQLTVAALAAVANLALLVLFLLPANAALQRYKEIAGAIPRGSMVLPIDTLAPQGRYEFMPHAGSYAVTESGAIIPSLFAADEDVPQSYFHYRHRPYSPTVYWYTKGHRTLDWARVQREYRYLLVTRPWDAGRIPVPFSIVQQNEVAALLDLRTVP